MPRPCNGLATALLWPWLGYLQFGKLFQGREPAFNTKVVLGLPYNGELPIGYECENKTATNFNGELGVNISRKGCVIVQNIRAQNIIILIFKKKCTHTKFWVVFITDHFNLTIIQIYNSGYSNEIILSAQFVD